MQDYDLPAPDGLVPVLAPVVHGEVAYGLHVVIVLGVLAYSSLNFLSPYILGNLGHGRDEGANKRSGSKKLDIRRDDIKIKQYTSVTYLGCVLDENLSGESMATRTLSKINGRLRFLYRKHNFLDFSLRRLLANALIQPHFDYAGSAWFPMLTKRLTKKIQTAQINVSGSA